MAKVMISLPDEFLEAVDAASLAEHHTRSEFIREALRACFQEEQPYKRPIDNRAIRGGPMSPSEQPSGAENSILPNSSAHA